MDFYSYPYINALNRHVSGEAIERNWLKPRRTTLLNFLADTYERRTFGNEARKHFPPERVNERSASAWNLRLSFKSECCCKVPQMGKIVIVESNSHALRIKYHWKTALNFVLWGFLSFAANALSCLHVFN